MRPALALCLALLASLFTGNVGCTKRSSSGASTKGPATPPSPEPARSRDAGASPMNRAHMDASAATTMGVGTSTSGHHIGPRAPLLAKGPNDPAAYGCKQDSDCAITCRADGQCCPEPCQCKSVVNRLFLPKLLAHLDKHCPKSRAGCLKVSCGGSAYQWVPRCQKGRCRALFVPHSVADRGDPSAKLDQPTWEDVRAWWKKVQPAWQKCLKRYGMAREQLVVVRFGGRHGRLRVVHLKPAGQPTLRRCLRRAGYRIRVKTFRMGTSRPFRIPPR